MTQNGLSWKDLQPQPEPRWVRVMRVAIVAGYILLAYGAIRFICGLVAAFVPGNGHGF